LLALADRSTQIHSWAKAEALEKLLKTILRDPTEKAIIFTHFRRTLEKLAELLQTMGVDGAHHGEWTCHQGRHRGSVARIFCFHRSGGQLCNCRTMINFDIP
jgi:hypothetical protein